MWISVARIILKNRIFWLCLIACITVVMGFEASKVEMSYKYSALLPRNDSAFIKNAEFEDIFGDKDNMMVMGIQHQDFFDSTFFCAYKQMEHDLSVITGVKRTFSTTSAFLLSKNTQKKTV